MICHFLIGVPGSGKTTFAAALAKQGNYRLVSTDAIRQKLYGDGNIQGDWSQVEATVICEIVAAITQGYPIIYDATNAKRPWRLDLLGKLNSHLSPYLGFARYKSPLWLAWHLQTPIKTCKLWNQQRSRQVPDVIIENMYKSLQQFPPIAAEGFVAVKTIDITSPKFDFQQIPHHIQQLSRSLINRANRHSHVTFHTYSHLLDFERLMHLLSLIIRYPGIGNLQINQPSLLENILGEVPNFTDTIAEITACMAKLCGQIYADENAIAADLQWLQQNALIAANTLTPSPHTSASLRDATRTLGTSHPITPYLGFARYKSAHPPITSPHPYSHLPTFQRLIATIRCILHQPYLQDRGSGSLQTLFAALQEQGILPADGLDSLRKDIEKILKPYKILPDFPLRDGYFAGTAILSKHELSKVFDVLQSQAHSLDDPIALEIYETFATRMQKSKLGVNKVYPVRAIANRSMIEPEYLPSDALSRNLQALEEAIANGKLLELNRFAGGGKFTLDETGFFCAYPLQIVFCNTAWYLGYECIGGKYAGLFRFERLDRLFIGKPQNQYRSPAEQEKALHKLQQLCTASAGIFLGYSASDQRQFLSQDKQERAQVCVTVELWFNDTIFRFISEGTKRFPPAQMKMSPPVDGGNYKLPKSIFSLKKTDNQKFPNRFRVVLPKWCLGDVELRRWIIGFGGNVKVVQPRELVDIIQGMAQAIIDIYQVENGAD